MADSEHHEASRFALHRIPNSLMVLLTVALLLQGPVGAFEAIWHYAKSLVETLLGGEDLFIEVICQTAPLTFAVALMTCAFRFRWLTFRSASSIFVCSVILLAATWLGGPLRSFTASHRPLAQQSAQTAQADSSLLLGATVLSASFKNIPTASLSDDLMTIGDVDDTAVEETITIDQAIDILGDFRAVATDGSRHDWRQSVPRVALAAESGSLSGVIGKAFNQILGYLVFYRPRLFFAAILLGSYIGWSWQPYLEPLLSCLSRRDKSSKE